MPLSQTKSAAAVPLQTRDRINITMLVVLYVLQGIPLGARYPRSR